MAEEVREFALLCPNCGQQNPPEFPVCWSCHADLPVTAPGVEEHGAPEETPAHRAPDSVAARRQRIRLEVAMVLVLVWLPWPVAGICGLVWPFHFHGLPSVLWESVHGVGLLGLLFYLAWLDGDWRRRLGLERPRILHEALMGLGVWVAMVVADALVFWITTPLGLEAGGSRRPDFEPAALWIAPVYLLIFALVEEVFYRAYLWNRLTELTRRPKLSIALSALLFSVAHVYPLQGSITIFVTGMALGWIFAVRRSLWGLVLGHWVCNLVITYSR
jgi:membrane protease YdiL (CAAX protease family)